MDIKVAIVTGAGSGIGRQAALGLLGQGYSVALAGRRQDNLDETARLAGDDGERALPVATDVRDPAAVQNLFARCQEAFGRLDLLFNNAGAFPPSVPLEEIILEQWQTVVDVNLTGCFLCTQEAFKLMKSQQPMGGRIINNGSVSAQVPRPNSAPYTSTKHAVTGLTKSTSLDGRKYNIACGQIDIGNAATERNAFPDRELMQADGSTEVEPTMNVDNVTRAILYMAGLPLDANVPFISVVATRMPLVGRG